MIEPNTIDPTLNTPPDPVSDSRVMVSVGGPEAARGVVVEARAAVHGAAEKLFRHTGETPIVDDPDLKPFVKVSVDEDAHPDPVPEESPSIILQGTATDEELDQAIVTQGKMVGKNTSDGKNWLHAFFKSALEKMRARRMRALTAH